jgi:hypothetical protein
MNLSGRITGRWIQKTLLIACFIASLSAESYSQSDSQNLETSRSGLLRYNRVEGLFLGYGIRATPSEARHFTAKFSGGYGIHNGSARWDIGFEVDKPKWSASAELFDRTTPNDESTVSTTENTLFSLLFKGDYLDYFRTRNGFEVDVRLKPRRFVSLVGYLSAFQYRNMPVDVNWTIFRNSDNFRPNPTIREGNAAIFKTGLVYNNRRKSPIFRNAWILSAVYERGFREFPYNGIALSFKRYQKTIFGKGAFVARGLVASRESVDEQHLYDLGGISTLRGYRIKEYIGNRALLLNIDYLFRGDIVGKLSSWLGQFVELVAFADAGWVALASKQASLLDGFNSLRLGDIKTNVGTAVSLYRQLIRVNISRRLDSDIDDWTFSVRFRRRF